MCTRTYTQHCTQIYSGNTIKKWCVTSRNIIKRDWITCKLYPLKLNRKSVLRDIVCKLCNPTTYQLHTTTLNHLLTEIICVTACLFFPRCIYSILTIYPLQYPYMKVTLPFTHVNNNMRSSIFMRLDRTTFGLLTSRDVYYSGETLRKYITDVLSWKSMKHFEC